ncbi:RNA-directed DNA polymerase [Celeribacter halophilus]|uniref:Reverse transcriptase (RNA-dependent DNA polymerase) n=1 Tax=Celeribacter halophilus TaxID=576117 RepID=A0A1I3WIW3_9RHOB|nr:RNA-directed DNA polymerase [Celeribacter halophilus]PZX06099.1 reverse transcriptase (RNA-dependent DNA polymerase) [Celeribacter halophilus]SFK07468.1 Reverse transcriptase (RNA-dependent DNA polymerase) [Celeribacter halophilus]
MKRLIDASYDEAHTHFLKGSSYFNGDFPKYISFEPILTDVSAVLAGKTLSDFQADKPAEFSHVNYSFTANKDGRFSWRPYELIHPAIYVALVDLICTPGNWAQITARLATFENGAVVCCGSPVMSIDEETGQAAQVRNWWHAVEQRSIEYSLDYSHLIHTDVTDCYGSLYTHSIAWALHGLEEAKKKKGDKKLLGNQIDGLIQSSRYGQTNGIAQGSVLMDFVAELVLGWVDSQLTEELGAPTDFRILRYRDDYRIFANSDVRAEAILKSVSDKLRSVGMKLGVAKTVVSPNVVEGAIKPDKLAGIELQDLGTNNAKTIQKQLLRLHSFGRRFPNSGALRRLVTEFHNEIVKQTEVPDDLEVQIAIATDLGVTSPQAFPAIAGILSHLISLAKEEDKEGLWERVREKMRRVPYNGYLEIWLQRVTKPEAVGFELDSTENICQIVNGHSAALWESDWISSNDLKKALDVKKIIVSEPKAVPEVVSPEEIELFAKNAWAY